MSESVFIIEMTNEAGHIQLDNNHYERREMAQQWASIDAVKYKTLRFRVVEYRRIEPEEPAR